MLDGPAAVLEPRTQRPGSSPTKLSDEVKTQAIQVGAALESSGLDHGHISVHDKMRATGLGPVSSIASLARIFREAGVARLETGKRPRSSWRRFMYPAPNACWQLDATEYVLTGGRKWVIFPLIDDHSRYAVASRVAWGETVMDAIRVVDKAIAEHGVPQRLLSDSGIALNPWRRGWLGQLVDHVSRPGVEAITGKPYKPIIQGKNKRFHQTLFRYLDKQPLAESLAQLQAQVNAFDHIYNTERPHQGLPGRVPTDLPIDTRVTKVSTAGTINVDKVFYKIDVERRLAQVLVITDGDTLTITDLQGELLAEHTRPGPGVTYVGNGRPPGPRPKNT